ncbi:MAG: tetratricopeptide repeat protein [Candidatus Hermodarchaeota archaeon]
MYNQHTCPYCKESIEKHWLYCHNCGKPLITNLDNFIEKSSSQSHEERTSFAPDIKLEEGSYDTNLIEDKEIEDKIQELDDELRQREIQGDLSGDLLLKKASLYYKLRDFSRAISNLELALKNFLEANDLANVAICHNEIGLIYEDSGYFEQSIYRFDRSLSILKDLNDQQKVIQVLNNLGNVYYLIKDLEKSYDYYQKALNLAEKENLELEAVKSASNLVEILFKFKHYDRISKILKRNSDYFEKNQDIYGIIQTLIKYGKLYYFRGEPNYDQSYQNFNNALNLIRKVENQISIYLKSKLEWECYLYLGKLNLIWDNDLEAENFLVKSLEAIRTFELKEHIKEGIVLEDLAELYLLKGEDNKSVEYLNYAIEIYEKYGDKIKIAEIKRKLGNIYEKYMQNYLKARNYYEQSLEIFENSDYLKEAAEILNVLGDLCVNSKDLEAALNYFKQSKGYYQDLEDKYNSDIISEKIKSLNQ